MTRRRNSAQNDWVQNPDATWRKAFPLFSAMWDGAASLLGHEKLVLTLAAAAMVAGTFTAILALARIDPNWVSPSRVQMGNSWTLAAVALVGAWTSLGRGAWHIRFPLGALAAVWITVAHIAAAAGMGLPSRSVTHPLMTLAISSFALAAFGAAWLRSLGQWQLAGPGEHEHIGRLRLFQFSTASLFVMMMLSATILGLWQVTRDLEGLTVWHVGYLDRFDDRVTILTAAASALTAYAVVFGDWKTIIATCTVCWGLAGITYYLDTPRGLTALQAIGYSWSDGALGQVAMFFLLALAPLAGLRLLGFRREVDRSGHPPTTRGANGGPSSPIRRADH